MSERFHQHTGDDQLVYGMPKHMEGTARRTGKNWWHYVPKPNACEKCQAMKGRVFEEYPGPVHPNCKCEIRHVSVPDVHIGGTLQGFEDSNTERFYGGQKIIVEVRNLGPVLAGAKIWVDQSTWKETGHMQPGRLDVFEFTKFGEIPVPWEVTLFYVGADNCTVHYLIHD